MRRQSIAPGARDGELSPRMWPLLPKGLQPENRSRCPWPSFRNLVDEIMLVSDDQIAEGIRLLIKTTRQVAEGAGAAAVAAAMARRSELAGKNVGLILSGGNITIEQLTRILNHQAP